MGLRVFLGDVPVGRLELDGDDLEFRFEESYCKLAARPVLGLAFEERSPASYLRAPLTEAGKLPSFFRNYLPEGVVLELLERAVETWVDREYHLLAHLGEDLPGNIRVVADELLPDATLAHVPPPTAPATDLRFSLAGVQLKLSVLRAAARVTIPLRGQGGDWIAKLPSKHFAGLCENEHAMLRWAQASGLTVPPHELVSLARFEGVFPPGFEQTAGEALLVRRFDRLGAGPRVHQEDFAQVLGLAPDQKYGLGSSLVDDTLHLMTVANIVRHRCGPEDFDEFLKRVAFTVLSGNGDMHFKNWSLYYPNPQTPSLAPAYDLVCTVQYQRADQLAVGLCEPTDRAFAAVGLGHFERVARATGDDPTRVRALLSRFVRECVTSWQALRDTVPASTRRAVDDLHTRLTLLRDGAP